MHILLFLALLFVAPIITHAAKPIEAPKINHGPKIGESLTQRFRIGIIVRAQGGPCEGILATTPIPIEWPEQQVKIIEDDLSASVRRS